MTVRRDIAAHSDRFACLDGHIVDAGPYVVSDEADKFQDMDPRGRDVLHRPYNDLRQLSQLVRFRLGARDVHPCVLDVEWEQEAQRRAFVTEAVASIDAAVTKAENVVCLSPFGRGWRAVHPHADVHLRRHP